MITKNITEGKVFKNLLLFSIPIIIARLISESYSVVDFIIAGKVIGSDALSIVGSTGPMFNLISSIYYGISLSTQVRCAELFGSKDKKRVVTAYKTSIISTVTLMAIICILSAIFARPLIKLIKIDSSILDETQLYFTMILLLTPVLVFNHISLSFIQSAGDSKILMVTSTVSGIVNLVLNIIFTATLKMGVFGLALATIISVVLCVPAIVIRVYKIIKELDSNTKLEFDKNELKKIYIYAIPSSLQQGALYLAEVVTQPFVNVIGKVATAGFSIANRTHQISNSALHAAASANATFTSQAYGEKKYDKFGKGLLNSYLIQLMVISIPTILLLIFPTQIMGLFLKENDASVLEYAVPYIKYTLPFLFIFCYSALTHSFYRSCYAATYVVIQTVIGSAARILFLIVLPETSDLFSIYFSLSLSWVVESLFAFIIYITKAYYSKEMRENIKQMELSNNGL